MDRKNTGGEEKVCSWAERGLYGGSGDGSQGKGQRGASKDFLDLREEQGGVGRPKNHGGMTRGGKPVNVEYIETRKGKENKT